MISKLVFLDTNYYLCSMKKRFLLQIILLFMSPLSLLAQEQVDTLSVGEGLTPQDIEDLTRPIDPSATILTVPSMRSEMNGNLREDIPLTPALSGSYVAPQLFRIPPEQTFFPRWTTGYMYGYSGQYNDWLRGYQAWAGVGLYQQMGEYWTMNLGAQLSKNSIYYNTAQLDGSLHWQPNRHVGVTVFGQYSPGAFMSPVNFGPSFNFGGYVTMEGEYFGLDLGAQQYYDPFYGHDTEPIVRPFLKLGGAKLGVDVGPMIKDALQKDHRRDNGFNPIPQPVKVVPQVAPRR